MTLSIASFRENFSSWLWGVVLIIFAVAALVVMGWLELRADRLDQLEGRRVVLSSGKKNMPGILH